jgi:ketosteroid isomerase-like protein
MKKVFLVLCAGILLVAARAQALDVNAPIHKMLDAFNSGDLKALAEVYAPGDHLIIDEVAPFHWTGANANEAWLADLDKHDKAAGITDAKVKYLATTRTEIDGDTAYAVVSVNYAFNQKGQAMAEEAQMTFALHQEGGAWKVVGWVWTGNKPHPPR